MASARITPKTLSNGKFICRNLPDSIWNKYLPHHEIHMKMCKKIAQLTKVIFALSTKTDEHEIVLEHLKEKHDEQLQQMIASTREKISHYKNRIEDNNELRNRVKFLEDRLLEEEQNKFHMAKEIENIQFSCELENEKLKQEHSEKCLELNQKLIELQQDLESKVKDCELEKTVITEELHQGHRNEVSDLSQRHSDQTKMLQDEITRLSEEYEHTVQSLKTEINSLKEFQKQEVEQLREEKNVLDQQYQLRLESLKIYHEEDVSSLKNLQVSTLEEQMNRWKQTEVTLQDKLLEKDSLHQQKIKELLKQLDTNDDELARCRQELQVLLNQNHKKDVNISSLNHRLSEAKSETSHIQTCLDETESELSFVKNKCLEIEDEMSNKKKQLEMTENQILLNEEKCKDMELIILTMKDKTAELEKEKLNLQSTNQVQSENYSAQIRNFKQTVDKINTEKEKLKEDYRLKMLKLEEQWQDEKQNLQKEQINKYEEIQEQFQLEADFHQQMAEDRLRVVRQEMESKIEEERLRLINEKQSLVDEFEIVRVELKHKLEDAESQMNAANQELFNCQKELESTNKHLEERQEEIATLNSQMDTLHSQLSASRMANASLQSEASKLKSSHDSQMEQLVEKNDQKLDQLKKQLQEQFQAELESNRQELKRNFCKELLEKEENWLAESNKKYDEELQKLENEWLLKNNLLSEKIVELELDLSEKISTLQKERSSVLEEKEQLLREMLEAGEENTHKLVQLEQNYRDQLKIEHVNQEKDYKNKEKILEEKYEEQLEKQKEEYEKLLAIQKSEAEIDKLTGIKGAKDTLREEIAFIQNEAKLEHAELEERSQTQRAQIEALQLELDISHQNNKQKEFEMKESENQLKLQIEVDQEDIRESFQKLQLNTAQFKQQIHQKNLEIEALRKENSLHMRNREMHLIASHQDELDRISMEHQKESEAMIADFKETERLLREEISLLHSRLATDRHHKSKSDNKEIISYLKQMIKDRDETIHKLTEQHPMHYWRNMDQIPKQNFYQQGNTNSLPSVVKRKKNEQFNQKPSSSLHYTSTADITSSPTTRSSQKCSQEEPRSRPLSFYI